MAAVFADESCVAEAIAAEGNRAAIACINGPANIVISGQGTAVDAVLNRLRKAGIKSRRLVVSHAFHSPLMDPILDSFQSLAAQSPIFRAARCHRIECHRQNGFSGPDDVCGILAPAHSKSCSIRGLHPRFARNWTISLPRNRSPSCPGGYGSDDRAGG